MKALVTGATGQDGFYLTKHLAALGYEVHGMRRPFSGERSYQEHVTWHEADMADGQAILRVVDECQPDEVYNLAAQSHVGVSFGNPGLTFDINAGGALRLLEAIKGTKTRFYQASTSELFGSSPAPQNENTPFHPRSPYGCAKLAAYWLTVNYREAYGMHASNGILFNHESPKRGFDFVSRKIARAVARGDKLRLGNLDAKRDWGHAADYVRGMHLIVQNPEPGDYVLATGRQHTVREFVELAFARVGKTIAWSGKGLDETGADLATGEILVSVEPKFFRPTEVDSLCGDASKALKKLNWQAEVSFYGLVSEMVEAELKERR